MTKISVGFTIATPGSLDPGMHSDLEVILDNESPNFIDDSSTTSNRSQKAYLFYILYLTRGAITREIALSRKTCDSICHVEKWSYEQRDKD